MLITHALSQELYACSRIFIQLISDKLSEVGLTYPQFLVLSCLWEKDGQRVNEIGKKLFLDSGTLTPLLKKLESQNYIKRVRGEEDERTVTAELTYPGKSLQGRVQTELEELNSYISEIGEEKLEVLNQNIHGLLEELQSIKNQKPWKN